MDYSEAITYLKEHDIKKEDGTYYEFGEDIPEAPERVMTDQINEVLPHPYTSHTSYTPHSLSFFAGSQWRSSPSICHAVPRTSVLLSRCVECGVCDVHVCDKCDICRWTC